MRTDRRLALAVIPWVAWAFDAEAQLGGTAPDGTPNITFTPGLRLQPRYALDRADANNDFFSSMADDGVSHCGELAAPAAAP